MTTVLTNVEFGAWGRMFGQAGTKLETVKIEQLDMVQQAQAKLVWAINTAIEAGANAARVRDINARVESKVNPLLAQLRDSNSESEVKALAQRAIDTILAGASEIKRLSTGSGGSTLPSRSGGSSAPAAPEDSVAPEEESGISTGLLVAGGLALGALGLWLWWRRRQQEM